jgi:flagellin-like hook-associated protein FlgL
MSDIVLSAGVRQNLLSLQNTAHLMSITQNRLATGKKVNTALDNPTNFFTSAALNSRANDLNALLDSMSNGIRTLEAADNGLTAITKTIESMQSTLRQARQDKSFKTTSYAIDPAATGNISFSGGSVGATPVDVALTTTTGGTPATPATLTGAGGSDLSVADPDLSALSGQSVTISDGTNTATYTFTASATGQKAALLAALGTSGFTVAGTANGLNVSRADGANFTVTTSNAAVATAIGIPNSTASTDGVAAGPGTTTVKTVDALVSEINTHAGLANKVRASNDNGRLRIENQSTGNLTVGGINTTSGQVDGSGGTSSVDGNTVRANFVNQFNGYIDQLNKLADDASFNGVNLLRGDKLKITFNESGTSTIEIRAKDSTGNDIAINTSTLGILQATNPEFDSDDNIDAKLAILGDALGNLRALASAFGSNLSIVQNRQDFTKAMINTLQTGADNLVLADSNEEGANMLALQTRQQLSTTALSLSAQADQAVLRLFG